MKALPKPDLLERVSSGSALLVETCDPPGSCGGGTPREGSSAIGVTLRGDRVELGPADLRSLALLALLAEPKLLGRREPAMAVGTDEVQERLDRRGPRATDKAVQAMISFRQGLLSSLSSPLR
jgi:hypothetical protein